LTPAPTKILFTGSVATGRRVAESAPETSHQRPGTRRKDAMLVLADANLDVASSAALWGSFTNCGQVCSQSSASSSNACQRKFIASALKKQKPSPRSRQQSHNRRRPIDSPAACTTHEGLARRRRQPAGPHSLGGNARLISAPASSNPRNADVNSSMVLPREKPLAQSSPSKQWPIRGAIRTANDLLRSRASVWTATTSGGAKIAARLRAGAVR